MRPQIALFATLFLATSCGEKHVVTALPIPADRMDCQDATGARPKLSPEYKIDWSKVASVGQARTEHERFLSVIRGREQTVSTYVLEIEGRLFQCANDAAWLREREQGL